MVLLVLEYEPENDTILEFIDALKLKQNSIGWKSILNNCKSCRVRVEFSR